MVCSRMANTRAVSFYWMVKVRESAFMFYIFTVQCEFTHSFGKACVFFSVGMSGDR